LARNIGRGAITGRTLEGVVQAVSDLTKLGIKGVKITFRGGGLTQQEKNQGNEEVIEVEVSMGLKENLRGEGNFF